VCTPAGLPVTWALANPKLHERQVLMAVRDHDATLLRPAYRNRTPRPGEHLLKPIRQLIESVNDTLKGQLDLELHGARARPPASPSASPSAFWR
jgi:hypothetical protein